MNLTFDDEFDIVNELPDALRAISYLVEAVPYYQHGVGSNEKAEKNVAYFLGLLIADIATVTEKHITDKYKNRKETK